jgi:flagellar hook-basal body complex protein FliE
MATPGIAAGAYANLARLTDPTGGVGGGLKGVAGIGGGQGGSGGPAFGELLKTAVDSLTKSAKQSDSQTQALAAGKSNIVDVVTAVAETEVAVDALVAVRDRVIQAYEEIMKMPI